MSNTILKIRDLKADILSKSFGGVMYDVTPDSEVTELVKSHPNMAGALATLIRNDPMANGIDKGVANFIDEVLHEA